MSHDENMIALAGAGAQGLVTGLRYVGVESRDCAEWAGFGAKLLGMQPVRRGAELALRLDEQPHRILVEPGAADGLRYMGFEVRDAAALDQLAARLEASGVPVTRPGRDMAEKRAVADLILCDDPAGNRIELSYGGPAAEEPFTPGRSVSGFRTGGLGLGHMVLTVERIEPMMAFYVGLLGFALSDYALQPFKAYFFHVNPRHHTLAFVETGQRGVHHLMVEMNSLDDVGQGYDLAQLEPDRIRVTLGRHSNDLMTSFYVQSPGGFMVEYGWGGQSIEPDGWKAKEYVYGPSLWGHERSWLTPEKRQLARELRLAGAAQGIREPVHVLPGHFVPEIS